jgi:NAD(P)-dependent dehydrogenase (short-subunit alcohol dehydrogenase family)
MAARCVVITGASAGIGRAAAKAFALRGYRVALLARGREGLEGAREDVIEAGSEALVIEVDVGDHDQVEAAAERIERELGPIDVWVNNAMATVFCPVEQTAPKDFERATRTSYYGAVWGTMAALRRMKPRNAGTIVQVGSALAYRSIPLQAAYCGAKSALRGFTDSLRSELLHDKSDVHITMVQLSAFNTPQFDWSRTCFSKRPQPVPPIYQPELAAAGIVWAAEHRRRELYVGFPAVKAVFGNLFVPGLVDRLLAKQGYSGQLADEPLPADRQDNLYSPVPGDHGAHGRFDDRARDYSRQFWMTTHRGLVAVICVLALLLLLAPRLLTAWA